MQFEGLPPDALANARSLNRAFINLAVGQTPLSGVAEPLRDRLRKLSVAERGRLVSVPFLLSDPASHDVNEWQQAVDRAHTPSLLSTLSPAESNLVTAHVALKWSLAHSNRYAARFLSGAPASWLDYAATVPLIDLLEAARGLDTPVLPRLADDPDFWDILVRSAADDRPFVRQAGRYAALQRTLARADVGAYRHVASAACRRLSPPVRVADL